MNVDTISKNIDIVFNSLQLRKLKLDTNNIDQETLQKCLLNQSTLVSLRISYKTSRDAEQSAFLENLRSLETLQKIQLSYFTLSKPVISILQSITNLNYLNVSNSKGIDLATIFMIPKQLNVTTIVTPKNTTLTFAHIKTKLSAQQFGGRFQLSVFANNSIGNKYSYVCDGIAVPNMPFLKISVNQKNILSISRNEKAANSLYEANIYEATGGNSKDSHLGRFQVGMNKFFTVLVRYPKEIMLTKPNMGNAVMIQLGSMLLQRDFIINTSWTMMIEKGDCIDLGFAFIVGAIDSKF